MCNLKHRKNLSVIGIKELLYQLIIVKPPMSINEIVNQVVKNGNLKPLSEWYDNFGENGKRTLKEAIVEYLNVCRKAFI